MDSTGPTLVVLAAGMGSRFGSLKQLTAVGADGAAIMDILLRRARETGFARAVIVVAPGAEELVRTHLDRIHDPAAQLPVQLVVQGLVPGRTRPLGTADAALAAHDAVDGPFVVVNADDLYPTDAFALAFRHLHDAPVQEHALVAFRVGRTLAGNRPVSRALIDVDASGRLTAIREGTVVPSAAALRFESGATVVALQGDECVSMNMWAFRASAFEALAAEVTEFTAHGREGEVFLPDAVTRMITSGETVRVLVSDGACIGMTHEGDIAAVRAALS